jgi:hypothetical protein
MVCSFQFRRADLRTGVTQGYRIGDWLVGIGVVLCEAVGALHPPPPISIMCSLWELDLI